MEPNHARSPRSRQIRDWRDARGLVIEGQVVARGSGGDRTARPSAPTPRWGAALERAAALAPADPRVTRIALPAGLALVALAALALSPDAPERHGAADTTMRVAAAPVTR